MALEAQKSCAHWLRKNGVNLAKLLPLRPSVSLIMPWVMEKLLKTLKMCPILFEPSPKTPPQNYQQNHLLGRLLINTGSIASTQETPLVMLQLSKSTGGTWSLERAWAQRVVRGARMERGMAPAEEFLRLHTQRQQNP